MPRRNTIVKNKHDPTLRSTLSRTRTIHSTGLVDIHFHGAYGIDLMTAESKDLDTLSSLLWKAGIAGFCPTTLSAPIPELVGTVTRLGHWIRKGKHPGAKPLGIHLEGPFISPGACGAHLPQSLQKLDLNQLDTLWEKSQGTLKIITMAPETLSPQLIPKVVRWTKARNVLLSLGHSLATEEQAKAAFKAGFQGVTHAWNALPFHHRNPGALGAAIGNQKIYLELLIDQVHLAPSVLRWTLQLHPKQSVCFVSDSAPAAGLKSLSQWVSFGPLRVHFNQGACRLKNGKLAGGGFLLPESYIRWISSESKGKSIHLVDKTLRQTLSYVTTNPLRILNLPSRALTGRKIQWEISADGKIQIISVDLNNPIDSNKVKR